MPALLVRERHAREQASRLARIVVCDRGLETLPEGKRLRELAAQPAQEADGCGLGHGRKDGRRRISYASPVRLFSQDTKADALGRTALFQGLSRRDLEALAKATEDMEVGPGKVLCRQGDAGHEFFVIVEGEAEVTRDGAAVRRLGPNDFFGEIALVEQTRRTATVTATSPLRFFVLTRQSFRSLLGHQPEVEQAVVAALRERLDADQATA